MGLQRAAERTPIPWKNGRGVQYEIATVLDEVGGTIWRLSTADLEADAPFSEFPGVHREFCLATGAGVTLRIAGDEHACGPGSITRFDGGAATSMELWEGPCRAVNLMRPSGADRPSLLVLAPGDVGVATLAVVSLREHSAVVIDGVRHVLGLLDALITEEVSPVTVDDGVVVALVDAA